MSTDDLSHSAPDDVTRALDLLARRADQSPVGDRVVAVRRRARRRAHARTASVAAVLVLAVAGGGALLNDTMRSDRGAPAVQLETPGIVVRVEPETDPTVLEAVGPGRLGTGSVVVLRVRVTGLAPNGNVGLRVEQPGLGYSTGTDPDCAPNAPLREVNLDELETLEWEPGPARPETVVVTATACAPVGAQTQRFTVQVPASTGAP